MADVPFPPPSAVAARSQHHLAHSVVMRHTADLYWTSHLSESEREASLDYLAMYDLRQAERKRVARQRELAHLRRLDRAAEALEELYAHLEDCERRAAERERPALRVAA